MVFRDGKSRCFGFVGFAQASDAQAAQKYYNKTFMDAMRLEIEFAHKYGSEMKKNAWSKYTEGTSRNKEFMAATGANAVKVAALGPKQVGYGTVPAGQSTRQGKEPVVFLLNGAIFCFTHRGWYDVCRGRGGSRIGRVLVSDAATP